MRHEIIHVSLIVQAPSHRPTAPAEARSTWTTMLTFVFVTFLNWCVAFS